MKDNIIGFNDYQYNLHTDLEAKALKTYNKLIELSNEALGLNKVDIGRYINSENPAQYLVNEYSNLYLTEYPEHLDREHLFTQQSKVSLEGVMQLKNQLDAYKSKMGKYAPTINSKGFKSNIKKSVFDIYLDEAKRPKYEALVKFLECTKELDKYYSQINSLHFVRAYSDLSFDGIGVKINMENFRK